jgi:phosphoglycerol transferase MdoB-like AlkP superfamily enzyme
LLIFSLTFILDSFNGSSFVELNKSQRIFTKNNVAGSVAILYYHNLDNMLISGSNIKAPEQLPKSITFNTFGADERGNQLLIVVESFGLIRDSSIRHTFFSTVLSEFQKNGWKGSVGNTPFKGSTTAAEMRELLSLSGDYRFFLNQDKTTAYTSIFDVKLAQGYETIGVHSYTGKMFERDLWWKNIGIRSSYFMEDIIRENRYNLQLNYGTPFTSCQDEDAFDFLQSKVVGKQKVFGYLLSVNSHLPYAGHFKDATASSAFIRNFDGLTDEGRNQLIQIRSFLSYIAQNLDLGKWSEVLIVGDHMPPFLNKTDRDFYSAEKVPYLRIEKP